MGVLKSSLLALLPIPLVTAHFILNSPKPIGSDEAKSATAPCGGFQATTRTPLAQWPASGGVLSLTSADREMTTTVRFAPVSAPDKFENAIKFTITGVGDICLPALPPPKGLAAGTDAVLQVIGVMDDGTMYSCAAVKIEAAGGKAAVPGNCKNSTGITIKVSH